MAVEPLDIEALQPLAYGERTSRTLSWLPTFRPSLIWATAYFASTRRVGDAHFAAADKVDEGDEGVGDRLLDGSPGGVRLADGETHTSRG